MRPKEYRIKELLREKGLDGAIVSSPENFHYVTGFGGHQHTVSRQPGFTLAVMRADDKVPTHLTTMDFEAATFRIKAAGLNFVVDPYDTWVGLKTWDEIAHGAVVPDKTAMESSMDKLVQFMKACDLANKKVGIELDYLPVPYYKSLTEKFPEAEFVNISDLFVYRRQRKRAPRAASSASETPWQGLHRWKKRPPSPAAPRPVDAESPPPAVFRPAC